ncbi:C39 family peptidase, partial [Methanosarcina sp. 2.H.A.1B.4]|uniref:C39 family peptidase n=3 Tax=Methanosarcina TaxID=2207 RepID=UPI0006224BFC
GMVLIPAVSAQEEKDYSVTAEEAFKHANANMINFIATNTSGFENWTGASIDSKPLELYDPTGQKLYYQFSVLKNKTLIGIIDIAADKRLGQTVQLVLFEPKPFDATTAMNKSREIAKNEYPEGEIKSTQMVVYDYPIVGAMTIVKDKTTGVEHRIFVDAYTLEKVEDKPATETEPGIWSIYEQRLKNGIDNNLRHWQKSDELAKSIEQAAVNKGVSINAAVTEENIKKLSADITKSRTDVEVDLGATVYAQITSYYCGPATAKMLTEYYNDENPHQTTIYEMMNGVAPNGVTNSQQLLYYRSSNGMNKPDSFSTTTVSFAGAMNEINNGGPFKSGVPGHARMCRGYKISGSNEYLRIGDPNPIYFCVPYWEAFGSEDDRIYVRS